MFIRDSKHREKKPFSWKTRLSGLFMASSSVASPLASPGGVASGRNWDLSDSFIVNQVKTGRRSRRPRGPVQQEEEVLTTRDDSEILEGVDYEMLAVSSPFQSRFKPLVSRWTKQ